MYTHAPLDNTHLDTLIPACLTDTFVQHALHDFCLNSWMCSEASQAKNGAEWYNGPVSVKIWTCNLVFTNMAL